ncbi:MAG: phosphoenolpyruvate carboxykinase (ATP), partial [Miltoncostaeaceae bacterium]
MSTTEAQAQRGGAVGLDAHGITPSGNVWWNLPPAALYEHTLAAGTGRLAEGGALVVSTGAHTGRQPKDKFVVEEPGSKDRIWWGDVNQPISEAHTDGLRNKLRDHLSAQSDLYVIDAYAGADPATRIAVRVVSESAWHSLFAQTMFIRPDDSELAGMRPEAVILHAPSCTADPEADGTRKGNFVVLHPTNQEILIGGTYYAGEIKKSIFTLMNDLLPNKGILSMHCSANVGADGNVAVFFGLSGTGK